MLTRQLTGGTAVRSLPFFDPYIMETYLDDLRELRRQVYDVRPRKAWGRNGPPGSICDLTRPRPCAAPQLFKYKPELLPPVGEGMSKGECGAAR